MFIAVWHGGELLVIRNSYRNWYALPAGGVRRGETPAHAALRELREEVGIAVDAAAMRFAGDISTTFEFKRDRCSFFEVEFDTRPDFRIDGREVVWADFLTPSDALDTHLAPPVRTYLEQRVTRERTSILEVDGHR